MPKATQSNVNSRIYGTWSFGSDQGPDVLDPFQVDSNGVISLAAPGTLRSAGYDTTITRVGPGSVQIGGNAGVPTAAMGAAAGTTPPAAAVGAAPATSDIRGSLTVGSGTTPGTGALFTVTYSRTYATAPNVMLTETTTAASLLNPAVTSWTTSGFTVSVGTAPTASQANTTYGFSWQLLF